VDSEDTEKVSDGDLKATIPYEFIKFQGKSGEVLITCYNEKE
jgi:hypothetical protein